MYKLSLPIQNKGINDENKKEFVVLCKKAGVDRIFLTASLSEDTEKLSDNIKFFKDQGFEVGIWVGNTIGHGETLLDSRDPGGKPAYQQLVNLQGTALYSTKCPYDENFRRDVAKSIARLSSCGSDMLMLDDDFRISQHGKSPCCFCELHMARIREICGEDITREELSELAFKGEKNKYRDAYLKAQGESLELLARDIRAEVDKVNPNASISACSAYCSWDLDGTDPIRLTKILAGKNKPFLRLHGAPYWAPHTDKPVEAIPEIERMFASFCDGEGIEIFSEGDVYPRPRFNTPSSFLEIMDGALRADGSFDGILKYMLEYSPEPLYETGYIDRHVRNSAKFSDIERFFEKGANAGVRILIRPHLIEETDLDVSSLRQQSPYPWGGILLSMNSIPTVYRGEGICAALFGENARHFSINDFRKGAILDAVSAKILTERGIDVGLCGNVTFSDDNFGAIIGKSGRGRTAISGNINRMEAELKENAEILLSASIDGEIKPLAYRYENADGQRFFVFTFSTDALPSRPKFLCSYELESALKDSIEWISRAAIPVKVTKAPELYTLCEKGDNYTSVAAFNCFFDAAIDQVFELDREYEKIEFSNCSGKLVGNKVILDSEIHAFDFISFKAYN